MSATATVRNRVTVAQPALDYTGNVDAFDVPADNAFSATSNTMAQIIVDPDDAITGDPQTIEIELMQPGGTFTSVFGTDVITTSADHLLAVDDQIRFTNSGGALPPPLAAGTPYYARDLASATTLKVALTPGGTAVDLITNNGTGTHSWQKYASIQLNYPYGAPAAEVTVKDRRDGTVNDFSTVRLVHLLVRPLDPAANALGSGWLEMGDPSTNPLTSFSVPWKLDYTAADPEDEKHFPSILLALPEGIAYDSNDPLELKIEDGLSNINLRCIITLMGN